MDCVASRNPLTGSSYAKQLLAWSDKSHPVFFLLAAPFTSLRTLSKFDLRLRTSVTKRYRVP